MVDRPVQVGHDDCATRPTLMTVMRKETSTALTAEEYEHEEKGIEAELRSTCPKEERLRNCRSVCHSVARRAPLEKPKKGDTPESETAHPVRAPPGIRAARASPRRRGAVTVREGHREVHERGRHDEANDEQADVRSPLE